MPRTAANIHCRGCKGATALHWAAWCGRDRLTRTLLEHGANINATCVEHGGTPLLWAVYEYKSVTVPAIAIANLNAHAYWYKPVRTRELPIAKELRCVTFSMRLIRTCWPSLPDELGFRVHMAHDPARFDHAFAKVSFRKSCIVCCAKGQLCNSILVTDPLWQALGATN
jgi:Ankyrin repeats (many copies)